LEAENRIKHALAAAGLGRAITLVSQLVLFPVFISKWGIELYGEWLIVTAIPAYLVLSDVGLIQASSNEIVIRVARGERQRAAALLSATQKAISIMFICISGVIAAAMVVTGLSSSLGITLISQSECITVIGLLMAKVGFMQYAGITGAILRAERNSALALMLANALLLGQLLSICIFLIAGAGPVGVALADLLSCAAISIVARFMAVRRFTWVVQSGKYPQSIWENLRPILRSSLGFLAFPFSQAVLVQGVILLVGAILGPIQVVVYSAARVITNAVIRLIETITIAFWSEIGSAFGCGDIGKVRELHRIGAHLSIICGVLFFGVIAICGEKLQLLWIGADVPWDALFFDMMVVAVMFEGVQSFSKVVPQATNNVLEIAIAVVLGAIAGISFLWFLLYAVGGLGIPLAIALNNIIVGIVVLTQTATVLGQSRRGLLTDMLAPKSWTSTVAWIRNVSGK
jgi:O-antigen/teichoic acid export membrane protein